MPPLLTMEQVLAGGKARGFSDDDLAHLWGIVRTEAPGPGNTGDAGARQPGPGLGRGLIQIDLGEHPSVTEAQALNPDFALDWLKSKGGPRRVTFYGPRDNPVEYGRAVKEARALLGSKGGDPWWEKITGKPTSERDDKADLLNPGIGGGIAQAAEAADDVAGALAALGRLAATMAKAGAWLVNAGWKRILMVTLGLIGLVIAAMGLFGALVPSGAKQAVRSTARNVGAARAANLAAAK